MLAPLLLRIALWLSYNKCLRNRRCQTKERLGKCGGFGSELLTGWAMQGHTWVIGWGSRQGAAGRVFPRRIYKNPTLFKIGK